MFGVCSRRLWSTATSAHDTVHGTNTHRALQNRADVDALVNLTGNTFQAQLPAGHFEQREAILAIVVLSGHTSESVIWSESGPVVGAIWLQLPCWIAPAPVHPGETNAWYLLELPMSSCGKQRRDAGIAWCPAHKGQAKDSERGGESQCITHPQPRHVWASK